MSLRDLLRSLASRPAHARPFVPTDRLWKRGVGAAAAAVLVSTALVAQGGVTTSASWNDAEWVHAPTVGTLDCTDPTGMFASRGEGRVLSGSLLGMNLDNVAKIAGVSVTNDGEGATPSPADAQEANAIVDAYADGFDATALGIVNANLTGVLQLPLDTDLGLLGQYAQASDGGSAAGASGYITDSGAINIDGDEAGYPDIATLRLSDLLNALGYDIGAYTQEVADVSLGIGAVAGRAALDDPCNALWEGGLGSAAERDYIAAGLRTRVESPTVAGFTGAVDSVLFSVQDQLNGILGQTGLLSGLTTGLVNALTNALGLVTGLLGLRVAPSGTTISLAAIDLNLTPLDTFLTKPVKDEAGILSIDLSNGTVDIDTAALLGAVENDPARTTLNGLDPNTDIFADPAMVAELTVALGDAISRWIAAVDPLLASAVNLATITVNVEVPFQKCSLLGIGSLCVGSWQDAGRIKATVSGTLGQLLDGTATVATDTSALNLGLIGNLLTPLLGVVTSVLAGTLGPLVGGILQAPLTNTVLPLAKLPSDTLTTISAPISAALSSVFTGLSSAGLVSVTANAQNMPSSGSLAPPDWQDGLPEGRYDVAALRVGLLDTFGPARVVLYLGRASVGPFCTPAQLTASGCTAYRADSPNISAAS